MKNKKAFVTKFILMGVVILIVASLMIYTTHEIQRKRMEKDIIDFFPKSELKFYITKCVENTGSYALLRLGMQGGYVYLHDNYLDDSNLNVDYVYDNGYSLATLDQMSRELSKFMDNNLKSCVYKYIENRQRDYEIVLGNVTTTTIIAEEDVTFEVNFPVDVIENNSVSTYDSFGAIVHVRLNKIHKLIDNLLQKKIENNFDVYHDCFYEPKMNLSVVDYGDSTLFILEDEGSRYKNIESELGPYRFLFAVKG